MDLLDKMKLLLQDRTESRLAERLDITEDEARRIIKDASFADYLDLHEANTDKSAFYQQPTTTSGTADTDMDDDETNNAAAAQNTYVKSDGKVDHTQTKVGDTGTVSGLGDDDLDVEITKKLGREYEIKTKDGKTLKIDQDDLLAPAQSSFLNDLTKAIKTGAAKGKSMAAKDRVRVANSAEQDELRRLQELAGIEIDETASGGATAAGAIAASPSIIGNTAHKPTDRLRAKNRRKREKKK